MLIIIIIKAGAVLPPPTAEELEPVRLFTTDSTTVLLHMGRRPSHWKIIMKVEMAMMMMMTAPDSITIGQ